MVAWALARGWLQGHWSSGGGKGMGGVVVARALEEWWLQGHWRSGGCKGIGAGVVAFIEGALVAWPVGAGRQNARLMLRSTTSHSEACHHTSAPDITLTCSGATPDRARAPRIALTAPSPCGCGWVMWCPSPDIPYPLTCSGGQGRSPPSQLQHSRQPRIPPGAAAAPASYPAGTAAAPHGPAATALPSPPPHLGV